MSLYATPTTESDSYGTIPGVESHVRIFTDDGVFTSDTNPTDQTVAFWIDQVSDLFNVALAGAGFQTPIHQVDAKAALAYQVEMLVAELCNLANNTGRFFSARAQEMGISPMDIIEKQILAWVTAHATGFVNLGVPRVMSTVGPIGSRGYTKSGEKINPIFQRDAFGNTFDEGDI